MTCSCSGTKVIGWVAPDGDYDFEPCECEKNDKQPNLSSDE